MEVHVPIKKSLRIMGSSFDAPSFCCPLNLMMNTNRDYNDAINAWSPTSFDALPMHDALYSSINLRSLEL